MPLLRHMARSETRKTEFSDENYYSTLHAAHNLCLNRTCPRWVCALRGLVTSHGVLVFHHYYFTWPFNFVLMTFWWHILCALMIICKARKRSVEQYPSSTICNVSISMMSFNTWGRIWYQTKSVASTHQQICSMQLRTIHDKQQIAKNII